MTTTPPPDHALRTNLVFWLMWLLPGSAVVAGLATLAIAIERGDRPLPESYHWEGARLDADFARARAAATLGVGVVFEARDGQCRAKLTAAPREPAALMLLVSHGSDASLDRRLRLPRVAADEYRVACAPFAAGRWRLTLDDDANTWTLRASAEGSLAHVELRAHSPEGKAP